MESNMLSNQVVAWRCWSRQTHLHLVEFNAKMVYTRTAHNYCKSPVCQKKFSFHLCIMFMICLLYLPNSLETYVIKIASCAFNGKIIQHIQFDSLSSQAPNHGHENFYLYFKCLKQSMFVTFHYLAEMCKSHTMQNIASH